MLGMYETWPVNKYWHGDPCSRAPMSRACMDYQTDLLKADYGIAPFGQVDFAGTIIGAVQAVMPLVALGFGVWALASLGKTK